jgi:hypothetical protein
LKTFRFAFSDWLEKFLLSEAVGFGALMFIMYFLGMAHLYYRSVAYGLVFIIVVFTYKEIVELWSFAKSNKVTWHLQPWLSFKNFLVIAIALTIGIYTVGMFQQYPLGYDSLHTYAAFPKAYVENHGIVDAPYWFFSGFPKNGEMIFTFGMLLNSFSVTSAILFLFTLFVGILIYYLGKELFDKNTALLSVFFYITCPIIAGHNIDDVKIDLFLLFYSLISFLYLVKYLNSPGNKKDLIIAALFMGISAGIKYTFFYITLPAFLLMVVFSRKINFRKKTSVVATILLVVSLLFIPWAVKNYKFSGNPIEPIAGDYLSRDDVFLKRISESYKDNVGIMTHDGIFFEDQDIKDWKFILFFPFKIAFNIQSGRDSDLLNVGPVYLIIAPLAFAYFISRRLLWRNEAVVFVVSSSILWLLFTQFLVWYLLPTLIFTLILLSYISTKVLKGKIKFIFLVLLVIFFFSL